MSSVALLVCLVGCGREPSAPPETLDLGRQVYRSQSCDACHGGDRAGTELAPPLTSVHLNWSSEGLQTYLRHPEAVTGSDPRLKDLAGRWELEMPGVAEASPEEVRALALFLLHSRD
jgi:mono/diheme cytochrome c family protein